MSTATEVRERPIIFSGPMVRALLDGRKTQTRRVVKPQPPLASNLTGLSDFSVAGHDYGCPYGQPGDLLYVRETWAPFVRGDGGVGWVELIRYRADRAEREVPHEHSSWWDDKCGDGYHWRPSIHMPKWAARIWLRVTDVRVERVQEITETEAISEGVTGGSDHPDFWVGAFRDLWDDLNADRGYPWESNPWVWVVSFERTEAGR